MIEIIFSILFTILFAGIGLRITNVLKIRIENKLEELLLSIAIGFGTLFLFVLFMGVFGLLYRWSFIGITIILVMLFFRDSVRCAKILKEFLQEYWTEIRSDKITNILGVILMIFIFLNTIGALSPIIDADGLGYHVEVPKIYIKEHSINYLPFNFYSNLPFNLEMLYTYAMLIYNDIFAKSFHLIFGLLTAISIYMIGRKHYNKKIGYLASVFFYTIPMVSILSATSYVDLATGFYGVMATYYIYLWFINYTKTPEENRTYLLIGAFLVGIYAGFKITTFFTVLPIFMILILKIFYIKLKKKKEIWRYTISLILFFSIAGLVLTPWLIKSYNYTGDPVWPFGYKIFSGKNWNNENAALLEGEKKQGYHDGLWRIPLIPFLMTFNSQKFSETAFIGALPLIFALLGLFYLKIKEIRYILAFATMNIIIFYFLLQQTRYITHIFPFIVLIGAYIMVKGNESKTTRKILWTVIILSILLNMVFPIVVHSKSIKVVLGLQDKEEYLMRNVNYFPVMDYANKNLPEKSKVFLSYEVKTYYLERDYIYGNPARQGVIDYTITNTSEKLDKELKKMGVTHIIILNNRSNYDQEIIGSYNEILDQLVEKKKMIYSDESYSLYGI